MATHLQLLICSLLLVSCAGADKPNDETSDFRKPVQAANTSESKKDSTPETIEDKQSVTELETFDTIFIQRTLTKDRYHAIYIEKRKNTERFRWLTDFRFDKSEKEGYQLQKESILEKDPNAFTKHNTFGLPKNWLPVYLYKDNYYTYAPSDWGNAGKRILNNQEYISWYMDGPSPNPIVSSEEVDKNMYIFQIGGYEESTLKIRLIDRRLSIYLFEFTSPHESPQYKLYIPADKAHQVDMIVNFSHQKEREFQFSPVDVARYLPKQTTK